MSAEHANMLTEEPRNLVMELGLTPSTTNDKQLAEAFMQRPFTPVMDDLAAGDVIFAQGYYRRVGCVVRVWIDLAWQNTNSPLGTTVVKIRPPFEFDNSAIGFLSPAGVLSLAESDFGAENVTDRFYQPVLLGDGEFTRIHISSAVIAANYYIRLGNNEYKQVALTIEYPTNGVPIP